MASETETEATPIRDDDKEDVKESFKTILMELQRFCQLIQWVNL